MRAIEMRYQVWADDFMMSIEYASENEKDCEKWIENNKMNYDCKLIILEKK